jgi:hypothetical protein
LIPRAGAVVLLAVALMACTPGLGGSSGTDPQASTTTVPATTTTTIVASVAIEEFRSCLAERGVEIEEVPFDATGRPRLDLVIVALDLGDPAVADALSHCSESLNTGALDLGTEDRLRTEILAALEDFSACMRAWGVEEFPDPVPGFSGVGAPFSVAEIPYSDPQLETAADACRDTVLGSLPGLGATS